MKTHITKSWRTTAAGCVIAVGQYLVLSPLIGWNNGDHRHCMMVAGLFTTISGCVLLGLGARDHSVSSEEARGEK